MGKLAAKECEAKAKPGRYSDGDGLFLRVTPGGSKSWIFRFRSAGKVRDLGLGAYPVTSLALARQKARAARYVKMAGGDPVEQKRDDAKARAIDAARSVTFKQVAGEYIEAHRSGWRNEKHASQWTWTLETYVYPIFKAVPVGDIDTPLVLRALNPIWKSKPETASRVRGRIESVLDYARVAGYRQTTENPARWRGHLDHLLAKRAKLSRGHHRALAFDAVPAFVADLRAAEGVGALALELAILTAARSGEVRGARWEEFNFPTALGRSPPPA